MPPAKRGQGGAPFTEDGSAHIVRRRTVASHGWTNTRQKDSALSKERGCIVAKMTLERLHDFVIKHGEDIKVIDTTGKTWMIQPGQPDALDLMIDKADRFLFRDVWYTREGFTKLLEKSDSSEEKSAG